MIPSLLIVGFVLVWAITLGTAQMRCYDAARLAARAVARGESVDTARQIALDAAPDGAVVTVVRDGGDVDVVVSFTAHGPGWVPAMPDLRIVGSAVGAAEDGREVAGGAS